MQLVNFMKNTRRLARLELRSERIKALTARATEAKNDALVKTYAKETKRRAAEIAYLATRVEADLEDHPEWAEQAAAMREAVLDGSRGSSKAKAMMGAAIAATAAPAAAAATE
jgi:hypothetical protein